MASMTPEELKALMSVFLDECEDNLQALESTLLGIETSGPDAESIAEVFRIVHTLKGDAGAVGLSRLAAFAHGLEDHLDVLRRPGARISSRGISALLRAADTLKQLVDKKEGVGKIRVAERRLLERIGAAIELTEPTETEDATEEEADTVDVRGIHEDRRVSTMRVSVSRLDHLVTLAGELAVGRARMTQAIESGAATTEQLSELHHEHDLVHSELQELVLRLRMVAIGSAFRYHHRTVRDLGRSLGKRATFHIEGGDVEIDNSLVQLLRDPVTHIVRNAIDHGIESPEERERSGKSPVGRLTLAARHESGTVVLEVRDDGRGVDAQRVRNEAQRRGLADSTAADDAQIQQLVFAPGLTTAESVTGISGRGVGLDVVRQNLESIRGNVSIESEPGVGTKVRMRVPLTLAILNGLRISTGDSQYVLPADAVHEIVAADSVDTHRDGRLAAFGEETLPIIQLSRIFRLEEIARGRTLVVLQVGEQRAALLVDVVHTKEAYVIKPLTGFLKGVVGLAGSTILGNGEIAFILDVPGLLRHEIQRTREEHGAPWSPDTSPSNPNPKRATEGQTLPESE